jgi:peptidoglycan/LPS O-acetylase OafA/YrhL
MTFMANEKIESAEAIRGIACFFVVLSHLSLTFFPSLHHFFDNPTSTQSIELWIHHSPFAFWYSGTAAVYIFFVLSGVVLTYSIVNSAKPVKKILSMSIKRYPRLMLPALASCMLLWAAFTLYDPPTTGMSEWIASLGDIKPTSFTYAFYEGSFGAFWNGTSQYNWVLWTMKIEFIGSFALFFLLYLRHLNKWLTLLLPITIVALCTDLDYLGYAAFLIGALCYLYRKTLSTPVATIVLLFGLYCSGVHIDSDSYQLINDYLGDSSYEILNFLSGILIVLPILFNQTLSRVISNRLTIWLGKLSFSAYLIHLLILYTVGITLFEYLHNAGMLYAPAALLSCAAVIIVTFACSEVFFRLVDKNAITLSNKLANAIIK